MQLRSNATQAFQTLQKVNILGSASRAAGPNLHCGSYISEASAADSVQKSPENKYTNVEMGKPSVGVKSQWKACGRYIIPTGHTQLGVREACPVGQFECAEKAHLT